MNTHSSMNLDQVIEEFKNARDFQKIEELADMLGESGENRTIEILLSRLLDSQVQEDRDVEDAVCDALVKLGIMKKLGNLTWRFLEPPSAPFDVREYFKQRNRVIPDKYLGE